MFVTFATLALANPAGAQDAALHGTIHDRLGGALGNVRVTLENLKTHHRLKVKTDARGSFTFHVQRGQYRITCRARNFDTYSKVVRLENGATEIQITMQVGKITLTDSILIRQHEGVIHGD